MLRGTPFPATRCTGALGDMAQQKALHIISSIRWEMAKGCFLSPVLRLKQWLRITENGKDIQHKQKSI